MPFFQYGGQQIHYVDYDDRVDKTKGLPIVFVHGAGSSHIIWTLQIIKFKKRNRVIAIDLSGHGRSESCDQEPSIKRFALELKSLIENLGLDEFILAGHSMGGGVVMCYCLMDDAPTPTALVLADTSSDLDLSKLISGLIIEAFENHEPKYEIDELDEDFKTFSLADFKEGVTKFQGRTILSDLKACDSFEITDRLSEITAPALVIVGEDDDVITPEVALQLELALPRAEYAMVKGADHSPMVEESDTFNAILAKFVDWVERSN